MNTSTLICIVFLLFAGKMECVRKFQPSKKILATYNCFDHYLCNTTTNYPINRIQKLVKRNTKLLKSSGTAFETMSKNDQQQHQDMLSLRDDFAYIERNLCDTQRVTIYPTVAKDVNNRLRYVVNVEEYRQGIVFETCSSKKCQNNEILYNYETACKQKYIKIRLWSISEKGKLEYGIFPIPSTCVCTYYTTSD